jgi:urea transport system permease protein
MKLDRTSSLTICAVLGAALVLALLNQMTAAASAAHVPTYVIALAGKYLCFAMLALAVDLVWGFAGILSLGHAAFFALGGYAMGMYLMRQIGTRGVYGNAMLPDFMVFLGWKELPWYWTGFDWFGFAMLMAVLVPAVLAALTYALLLAFFRNDMGFGGNNGMTDFKDILGFNVQADSTRSALLVVSAIVLCAQFLLARFVVNSRFGKVLIAVRDTENRTRFLGYRPESYKLVVWVLSAVMAGIAGALYVPQVGIINPSEFAPGNSIEAVIWVAVGGRGTLVGAILGAILVNFGKTWLTGAFPEIWLYALGAMFIFVTLFLPRGVMGLFHIRASKEPEPPVVVTSEVTG